MFAKRLGIDLGTANVLVYVKGRGIFITKTGGRFNLIKPEVMICIPAGVTSVEQRAVRDAAEQAGARRPAHLIPEPLAAAIGARLPVGSPSGNTSVHIGG